MIVTFKTTHASEPRAIYRNGRATGHKTRRMYDSHAAATTGTSQWVQTMYSGKQRASMSEDIILTLVVLEYENLAACTRTKQGAKILDIFRPVYACDVALVTLARHFPSLKGRLGLFNVWIGFALECFSQNPSLTSLSSMTSFLPFALSPFNVTGSEFHSSALRSNIVVSQCPKS